MSVRHESQKVFAFKRNIGKIALIPDVGTSITVEFSNGQDGESEWVADPQSPVTTPTRIDCAGTKVRLTPDVGGFAFNGGPYELNR